MVPKAIAILVCLMMAACAAPEKSGAQGRLTADIPVNGFLRFD